MFPRNRYASSKVSEQLEGIVCEGDNWALEIEVDSNSQEVGDFGVIWGDGRENTKAIPPILFKALLDIDTLDNMVQDSCECEYRSSKFHIRNYRIHIAFLSVTEDLVEVEYYGSEVNTQWTAKFRFDGNVWKANNF